MENKLNTGAIFRNTYKTEGDNKPDYKGTIDVDGQPKEIALWLRTSKESNIKYFSVKISDPYQNTGTGAEPPKGMEIPAKLERAAEPPEQESNDDLPF